MASLVLTVVITHLWIAYVTESEYILEFLGSYIDFSSYPPVVPRWLLIFTSTGFVPTIVITIVFARFRLHAAAAIILLVIFWIIFFSTVAGQFNVDVTTAFAILVVLPLILLSVAPAKAVARRLIFLALGLLLLIALNELSKLGLDVTAPKLQG